jgi:hypothetical protein
MVSPGDILHWAAPVLMPAGAPDPAVATNQQILKVLIYPAGWMTGHEQAQSHKGLNHASAVKRSAASTSSPPSDATSFAFDV